MDGPQGQGSSSADFVRKLYKMLEDSSYDSVVRWGNEGDSFVVLENDRFTREILPKHFKHSNFASFVRQLNKYDFHKVRHNNEETGQSPYGPGAWEFKHPDFRANNKDALDNIRRKAPVPRKSQNPAEDPGPTPQMDLFNTQLLATQQQLQQMQDRYNELSMHHSMLLQEVIGLQKTVVNHEHVMQSVMSFLHSVDTQQRRFSKTLVNPFGNEQTNGPSMSNQQSPESFDEPSSPLQHASKLLSEVNADVILNSRNLEQMNEVAARLNNGTISTPPPSETAFKSSKAPAREPSSASSSGTLRYGELDSMVYPVGHTNGIDPLHPEYIENIPFPMPDKLSDATNQGYQQQMQQYSSKKTPDFGWIRQPQILLVEDDSTCRRIGGKFLYAFNCSVDSALDGLEAVNKLNAGSKYDLILMDIIMPNLDGVSACHLIRQFDSTPIIAMTSNIRSDDISMYFSHGMNDVLPKPFTKDGLASLLNKFLSHLKKGNMGMDMSVGHGRHSVKDEDSPGSPVGSSNMSDNYLNANYGMDGGMHQYNSGPQTPITSRPQNHRRQISEISGGPEYGHDNKRQQMYNQHMQMPGSR